ncbi:MAG: DEAD/DEAH box helicase [Bdellovibrionaceae bacterium]|nr:DEAD/DEAH box helicase [Pseudobdellovibrionaceae bacterium]
MKSFKDFGLLPTLQKSLRELRLREPTEIQTRTIPMLMSGQNVVGVAQTGSGKTFAYALPLLHQLKSLEDDGEAVTQEASPRAVVMVPTRELGEQVAKAFKTLTHDTRLRVRTALGGTSMEQARRNTSGPFEIMLATPGRLVQMIEQDMLLLDDVRHLIFDEADQMLEQGFIDDTLKIAAACGAARQMSLFSATVTDKVRKMIDDLFQGAELIQTAGAGKVVSELKTRNIKVLDGKRWPVLEKLLAERVKGSTMIFTNTREQCEKLAREMVENGYDCVVYRGEMDKNQRRLNLNQFRSGKVKYLVATDLAGRGLDIESVDRVINYHLPREMENYLHRAGRTARAGRPGMVVNLVTERDSRLMDKVDGKKTGTSKESWLREDPFARARASARPLSAKKKKKKVARRG